MTRPPPPRNRDLAPGRRADRLIVSLSPEDRATLARLASTATLATGREVSMAEVVRQLIREKSTG